MASAINKLSAIDRESGNLNVIIETPKGSRNKYSYNEELQLFLLKGVLPVGASFPYDFGFLPATLGDDGDPLDVLVLMDESAFTGCLVPSRLIGVIEAEQTESESSNRNDRLIAVAANSYVHKDILSIEDLNSTLLKEIEHFFISYNQARANEFKVLACKGKERAEELIREGERMYQQQRT